MSRAIYPSLKGKSVVVTGGGSGIGAALTEGFVAQGARVTFLDIADEESRALETRLAGAEVAPVYKRCNLKDVAEIERVFAEIGEVDVLVNNAANDDRHSLADITPEYWDDRIAVNLRHLAFCAKAVVSLEITGDDGYRLEGASSMSEISRDPVELARQATSEHHYPDGFALFTGTMFAPTQDRGEPGKGFTHKVGDVVRVSTPSLGTLENKVATSRDAPAWTFGISDLMRNLSKRGLI